MKVLSSNYLSQFSLQVFALFLLPALASAQCDTPMPSGRACGPTDFFAEADPHVSLRFSACCN